MYFDDNEISIDNKALAAVTGEPIALNMFKKPGRMEPIHVACFFTEAGAGGTSATVTIKQADDLNGSYTDVESKTVALANIKAGASVGWRYLPTSVTKPFIKFVVSVSGTFTGGKIFAAVSREEKLPYEAGMYINKGVVEG